MAKPIEDEDVPVGCDNVESARRNRLVAASRCRRQNLGGSAHVPGREDEAKTAIAQPQCRDGGEQAVFVSTMGASGQQS